MGCPIALLSRVAISRATKSVPPPAGKGTIRRTGLAGQSCAVADDAHSRKVAQAIAVPSTVRPLRRRARMIISTIPRHGGIHHGVAMLEHVLHLVQREIRRPGSPRSGKLLRDDVALDLRSQNI